MRKLITLLLLIALFAVTVLPDDHATHRTVEDAVEAVWCVGAEAARDASDALSDGETRAAFRWVASRVAYDTDLGKVERVARDTQSPEAVLQAREAVCEGYARLFVALAEEMGLKAEYITGEADPVGPGGGGRHAWNAVKFADGWYYLDPTWAAGHVTQGRFVSEFDEE